MKYDVISRCCVKVCFNANLGFYRKEEVDNTDLTVQLDVFEQWKANDDEQLTGPDGVDLSDPLNVFHAVFKQVRAKLPLPPSRHQSPLYVRCKTVEMFRP